ncbi:MAG: Xaa-Pro peptidase family protein [candidate division NC10 bacterium]
MLRITADEYRKRLEALQGSVEDRDLDLFLVTSLDSIYYLTGAGFEPLERPFFLLVRPRLMPLLLVPKLEQEHMNMACNVSDDNIHTYWDYPAPPGRGWPERLQELIGNADEIGVEPTLCQEFSLKLNDYTLRVEGLVEDSRLIKSETEIALIQRAAGYADFGVQCLLGASYQGATVAEGLAQTRSVSTRIIQEVEDWDPLTTKVTMATWAAPRSAQPHSIPDLCDSLKEGPHVALVLTRVNGYAAENERTYFTTSPSAESKRAFEAMRQARRLALDQVRPGLPCSELDGVVNDFLEREGYGGEEVRLHRIGHGLGLGNHEAPWVAEGSPHVLAENMVISIEPGIYLKGLGGFRHSDTVLVTREGCRSLTDFPTDLESLTITKWKPWTRLKGWWTRRVLRLNCEGRVSTGV